MSMMLPAPRRMLFVRLLMTRHHSNMQTRVHDSPGACCAQTPPHRSFKGDVTVEAEKAPLPPGEGRQTATPGQREVILTGLSSVSRGRKSLQNLPQDRSPP